MWHVFVLRAREREKGEMFVTDGILSWEGMHSMFAGCEQKTKKVVVERVTQHKNKQEQKKSGSQHEDVCKRSGLPLATNPSSGRHDDDVVVALVHDDSGQVVGSPHSIR